MMRMVIGMMMMMMIRTSRGNPVKSRNRQLLSMQHRQNNNKDILCNLQRTLHKLLQLMMIIHFVKMNKNKEDIHATSNDH